MVVASYVVHKTKKRLPITYGNFDNPLRQEGQDVAPKEEKKETQRAFSIIVLIWKDVNITEIMIGTTARKVERSCC